MIGRALLWGYLAESHRATIRGSDRCTFNRTGAVHLFIKAHLSYATAPLSDLLLQVEVPTDRHQTCRETRLVLNAGSHMREVAAEEGNGTRRWITTGPLFECRYETRVEVQRPQVALSSLGETPRMDVPSGVIKYLFPSRYCQSDLFQDFVALQFGALHGGELVLSISNWIGQNFVYDNAASHAGTTATDSFACQAGVCRDYAHVMIALVRAAGIPARFVSAYAPDARPQDFHAVVEVYLGGDWHLVDPTGMADAAQIARICVGRDAADTAFLTSYGGVELIRQSVQVDRLAL